MKPDPAAKMLLMMAEKDYTTLYKMADDFEFADEVFGFHAQQAAEKAAKAMLAGIGITFDKTHDLELLFDTLVKNGCIAPGEFSALIDLTDFAVQYRYQAFDELASGIDRMAITAEIRKFLDCAIHSVDRASGGKL
jgi:HEPN domain-containing protein